MSDSMTPPDHDLKDVLTVIGHGMTALEILGNAASSILSTVGKDNDAAVVAKSLAYLKIVVAVVDAVSSGMQGTVDPSKVQDELAVLRSTLQANDAEAQAALDVKFPQ